MATDFPTSLDDSTSLPNPSSNSPTNQPSLSGGQTNQNDAIKALESKVGINSSADTSSIDYKLSHLTPSNVGLSNVNNTSDANKPVSSAQASAIASAVAAAMQLIFPIGSVYTSTSVATSPATLLGFGTWTAISGYTLVGYKSGDANFGATGVVAAGEATHVLSTTEMPAHTHTKATQFGTGDSTFADDTIWHKVSSTAGGTVNPTGSTGGGGAHNNIQPSFVVYVWQRTA